MLEYIIVFILLLKQIKFSCCLSLHNLLNVGAQITTEAIARVPAEKV